MLKFGRTTVLLAGVLASAAGGFAQQRRVQPPPARPAPQEEPAAQRPSVLRSELAYPTGERATSVVLIERFTPSEVRAGVEFEYQIRVTNLTRLELRDVALIEDFPANFTIRATDPQMGWTEEKHGLWKWPSFTAGATATIRVFGTASSPEELNFCATVRFGTVLCARTAIVTPKLVLTKTLPPEVMICDPIPMHLTVSNTGTGVLHKVRITDTLPEGLTTADNKNGFAIDVGDLAAGQTREYNVPLRATKTGEITNTAQAEEEGGLRTEASAEIAIRQPVLVVSKRGPQYRYLGRPVTFEITVQNTGDTPARDVVLVDAVPPGTEFVSADGGGQLAQGRVTWSLGTLDPDASKTVKLNLQAVGIGTVQNTAVARAICAEAQASAAVEIRGVPAILLEMVDDPDPIEIGGNTTYTIVVTNQGSANDTNIVITAIIPPEEDFVSCDGVTKGAAEGKTVTFAPLRSLAPKAKATWKVIVKGNKEADVRFKVILNSDTTGKVPVEKTESTHIY